jgi:iron(II)-dependent oxidoreductase
VGSFAPNGYGLFDTVGNVAEWTADWYNRTYYSVSPDADPKGPDSGIYRVIRGGGWAQSDERNLATHFRNYTNPEHRTNVIGFRCVRSR